MTGLTSSVTTQIRQAERSDALHVAAIIDIAGHGIALEEWMERLDSDNSVISAVRRIVIEDDSQPYHYSQAHLIEIDGTIAGGLIGGVITQKSAPADSTPAYLQPLLALENRVPGYWSVVAVAIYPEYRGRGLASKLLDYAIALAGRLDAPGLSIVTEDTNASSLNLYKKKGFIVAETLPWLPYASRLGPTRWVMLTRPSWRTPSPKAGREALLR